MSDTSQASDVAGLPPVLSVSGTVMHTPERGIIEIYEGALVEVGADGRILAVIDAEDETRAQRAAAAAAAGRLVSLREGQVLLPGLVDLHVHAPQWPQLGKALNLPLEQWLAQATFPLEARYADTAFATRAYESLVDNLLANGTTTALYFGSLHLEATRLLAGLCHRRGQRALIGKVVMDDPALCPDFYRDASPEAAIAETEAFIDYVEALSGRGGRVRPVVTPRFIPACSDAALRGLGELAARRGVHVQSHVSESDWEHAFVLERTGKTDTRALEAYGLLGRHTVLAHGNFICDDDMEALAGCGAGIAHCPLSNAYFSNAVFPLAHALEKGVHVGLGTDISGGPDASLFSAARHAVAASRMLNDGVDARLPPATRGRLNAAVDIAEAFWLATAGGGIALDLPVGVIAPGYAFDAIVIDTTHPDSDLTVWPDLDEPQDIFQRILYSASRVNVRRVWVDGQLVTDKDAGLDWA